MKWQDGRKSSNIEDRRRQSKGKKPLVGGISGLVLIVVITLFSGGNIGDLINNVSNYTIDNTNYSENFTPSKKEEEDLEFVSVVLGYSEDIWREIFNGIGKTYNNPKLVVFRNSVQSACGFQNSATGPFYCPADEKVYIDLGFYEELSVKFNAPGDFAMAYVIAHEIGHHVQNQLGIMDQVMPLRNKMSEKEFNKYQVRLELQADYLAGVFAYHLDNNNILDPGDIDEAIQATIAVGDDTLQKEAWGYVVPDSFTHGSAQERKHWFLKGYQTGDLTQWNTFKNIR